MLCLFLIHFEELIAYVVTSVSSETSRGFVFREYHDSGMMSLTCLATHLPREAKYLYTVDMERKPLAVRGEFLVIASLKSHGEYCAHEFNHI